jgi:LAO/AO transport system kinase
MHWLAEKVLAGDRLALARTLTQVENDTSLGRQVLQDLYPSTGKAHIVGITGAPGTGKSSLVNRLSLAASTRTGILAVDPTSPFTGGALLGDRVRMADLAGKPDVFIRSMASRGALGGLASATANAAQVMDAAGFELVLIETVGAGQAEVEIARLAHTVIVVEAPGMGDDIQAGKAGILEIADILVVNKADIPGADHTARILQAMLELGRVPSRVPPGGHHGLILNDLQVSHSDSRENQDQEWLVPVLLTTASTGEGIDALYQAVKDHRSYLVSSGRWQKRDSDRLARMLELAAQTALVSRWRENLPPGSWDAMLTRVQNRELAPSQAIDLLIDQPGK